MVDKCEIKVPKSRGLLSGWLFVRWPFVGGLLTGVLGVITSNYISVEM